MSVEPTRIADLIRDQDGICKMGSDSVADRALCAIMAKPTNLAAGPVVLLGPNVSMEGITCATERAFVFGFVLSQKGAIPLNLWYSSNT